MAEDRRDDGHGGGEVGEWVGLPHDLHVPSLGAGRQQVFRERHRELMAEVDEYLRRRDGDEAAPLAPAGPPGEAEKYDLGRLVQQVSEVVGCGAGEWAEVTGPEAGVGVEFRFRRARDGEEGEQLDLYVCCDGGDTWTWEVTSGSGGLDVGGTFGPPAESDDEEYEAWRGHAP